MRSVIVAGSRLHAAAMIRWLRLDPKVWQPLAYGDGVEGTFEFARIVRPSEGVTEDHQTWVFQSLIPNICLTTTAIPETWRPSGALEEDE